MRDKSLRYFLLVSVVLAMPAMAGLWQMGRFHFHVAMNSWHSALLDGTFLVLTTMANGWVAMAAALLLLLANWRAALMMGLSTGLSALLTQFLKRAVFDLDRPSMFLGQMPGLQLVSGLDLHQHFSFPSGHATAAYSMCAAVAVVIGRRPLAMALAVLAALMAFSRVYLSQHFTEDILAGAAIGCTVSAGVYYLLYKGPLAANKGLDRSPVRRIRTSSGRQ